MVWIVVCSLTCIGLALTFEKALESKRRAEIAAKRAKLEEMQRRRRERESARQQSAAHRAASSVSGIPASIDALIGSSLGSEHAGSHVSSRVSSMTGSVAGRSSDAYGDDARYQGESEGAAHHNTSPDDSATFGTVEGSRSPRLASSGPAPTSLDGARPVEPPERPRVTHTISYTSTTLELYETRAPTTLRYTKGIQADTDAAPAPPPAAAGDTAATVAPEILRARLLAELDAERAELDRQLAAERVAAAAALEHERAAGLSPQERAALTRSEPFRDFVEDATRVAERALADTFDYTKDFRAAAGAPAAGPAVRSLGAWFDPAWGALRSVMDLDWSHAHPELFAAAYNKASAAVDAPNGVVAVWNVHVRDRPEFQLHAQSDVLSVHFDPSHASLVAGGTYAGQVVLWDVRARGAHPVLKTPLAGGHAGPVCALASVGAGGAAALVSAARDGSVCTWALDMLAQPQERLALARPPPARGGDVAVSALGVARGDSATFWVGADDGGVYAANRYDRAGAKAGLVPGMNYAGHVGPVTGLHFHPAGHAAVDLGDLFITSGVDYTVKVWTTGAGGGLVTAGGVVGAGSGTSTNDSGSAGTPTPPILSFDQADDYVFDAKWHPTHPALFGSVNGSGKIDIWNINADREMPVSSTSVEPENELGLNKMMWERKEGRTLAVGSVDGRVHLYDVRQDIIQHSENDWEAMRQITKPSTTFDAGM